MDTERWFLEKLWFATEAQTLRFFLGFSVQIKALNAQPKQTNKTNHAEYGKLIFLSLVSRENFDPNLFWLQKLDPKLFHLKSWPVDHSIFLSEIGEDNLSL